MSVQPLNDGTVVESIYGHRYLRALDHPLPRKKVSLLYLVMLTAVALLMVLLPIAYLAIIAGVGWAIYEYVIGTPDFLLGRARGWFAIVAYLGPPFAGCVLIVFMLKPLFAPRQKGLEPRTLNRNDQPLLFVFVDKLCDTVGAPRPANIRVDMDANASAGFHGFWSGIFGGQLVLTIGLPLVSAMSLNQLTGVLAHEFGHFSQRSAMRLSHIIIRINRWFARVVYQRDGWDDSLSAAARGGGYLVIQLICLLAVFGVWISRKILWLLMMTGHLFCSMLSRQMEFDADQFTSRVVGSAEGIGMIQSLPRIGMAMEYTYAHLGRSLQEKRLPDDVPQYFYHRLNSLSADALKAASESSTKQKTGWFDTHPAPCDRISALRKLNHQPIFNIDMPAHSLFSDYAGLSRQITQEYYREQLGQRAGNVELVVAEEVESNLATRQQQAGALNTYLLGLFNVWQPVHLPPPVSTQDHSVLADRLMELRTQITDAAPAAKQAFDAWWQADEKRCMVIACEARVHAGIKKVDPAPYRLPSADLAVIRQKKKSLESALRSAEETIAPVTAMLFNRMEIAHLLDSNVAVESVSEEPEIFDLADEPAEKKERSTLTLLLSISKSMVELRTLVVRQQSLLELIDSCSQQELYRDAVISNARRQCNLIGDIRRALASAEYPYAAQSHKVSLAEFIFVDHAHESDIGGTMNISYRALEQYFEVYMRTLAERARRAEEIEADLGLLPLVIETLPQPIT